jgi:hypothetical protein
LTPVEVRFAKQLSEGITIRLDSELLAKLYETARTQGTDPALLARAWVLEHLDKTKQPSSPSAS